MVHMCIFMKRHAKVERSFAIVSTASPLLAIRAYTHKHTHKTKAYTYVGKCRCNWWIRPEQKNRRYPFNLARYAIATKKKKNIKCIRFLLFVMFVVVVLPFSSLPICFLLAAVHFVLHIPSTQFHFNEMNRSIKPVTALPCFRVIRELH